jgi:two-component system sensor histidine kinase AlgZ
MAATPASDPTLSASPQTDFAAQAAFTYWACQVLGWGLNAFAQINSAVSTVPDPFGRATVELVLLNILALALTHLLRGVLKRRQWHTLTVGRLLPRLLLSSVAMGLLLSILMHFMSVALLWTGPIEDTERLPAIARWLVALNPMVLRTVNWSAMFFLWVVLYLCITSLRDRRSGELRQSELRRALQLAELRLLKSQLNPHFLFNSLNSVRALIADDPSGAQRAVTQLARTLRYTLSAGQEELVSLERELEIVDDYLELESLRLGERLRIDRHVNAPADRTRIPVMLLQTVVENAIKHGIAELPDGGVLRIRADVREDALTIEVENPRPATPGRTANEGVGLRNAAERLRLLFGAGAMLHLDLSHPGMATTRIRIPQTL